MAEALKERANTIEIQDEGSAGTIGQPGGKSSAGPARAEPGTRKRTAAARAKRAGEALSQTPQIESESEQPAKKPAAAQRRNPKARAKDRQVGVENAAVILSLLDGLAVSMLGPDAALNDFDRLMIADPLERIMGRLQWETGEAVNRWADPILLVIGLIGWGNRLVTIYQDKRKASREPDPGLYHPKTDPLKPVNEDQPDNLDKIGELSSAAGLVPAVVHTEVVDFAIKQAGNHG